MLCHSRSEHSDTMTFDQGEFNFDARGSEAGYRKWRQELEEKQREFESRWGVVLSRRVSVSLKNFAKPIEGRLEILSNPKNARDGQPVFRIKSLEFTAGEIERLVQVESPV
jgi:hypothetical protein